MQDAEGHVGTVARGADPLDAIDDMVLAHRWAKPDRLKELRALLPPTAAGAARGPEDVERWLRLLTDQRVLDEERRGHLDAVIHQQRSLPRFRLLKKLGAGGMGTVWLARLDGHDAPLALKVINARLAVDSDFLGRFTRETQAVQGLRHPSIAAIIESGGVEGTHYLAMEYINGPSLGEMLKQHKALPEAYVLRMIRQVAEGLQYVNQSAGLIHRDVKPENILVQRLTEDELFPEDDIAKLIDFGLVKSANDDEHLTQTGMTIGTPLYMSPEQVRGEKLDGRSDIYALGATMYHLLTGTAPFKGTSPGAIMSAHLTEPVPDPGDLVPSLGVATRRLVTMSMAKSADDRFRGFDALMKAIDEAIQGMSEKDGAMRLLRKPLVIAKKPTPKKTGTDVLEGPKSVVEVTERIAKKHDQRTGRISSGRLPAQGGAVPAQVAKPVSTRMPQAAASGGGAGVGEGSKLNALTERRESNAKLRAQPQALEESVNLRPSDLASPGTQALTRAHDERKPQAVHAQIAQNKRSAVFDEDGKIESGMGILPWTVLGGAIVIAVCFAVWHLVL